MHVHVPTSLPQDFSCFWANRTLGLPRGQESSWINFRAEFETSSDLWRVQLDHGTFSGIKAALAPCIFVCFIWFIVCFILMEVLPQGRTSHSTCLRTAVKERREKFRSPQWLEVHYNIYSFFFAAAEYRFPRQLIKLVLSQRLLFTW